MHGLPHITLCTPSWTVHIDDTCKNTRMHPTLRVWNFNPHFPMTYDTNFAQNTIKAYFGQKDAMQCVLMRRLVEDLNLPPAIVVCDTGK